MCSRKSMCHSGLSFKINVGSTQSAGCCGVCCAAIEAKQIIRGVVRRQHAYVKCDCEEATATRKAQA